MLPIMLNFHMPNQNGEIGRISKVDSTNVCLGTDAPPILDPLAYL